MDNEQDNQPSIDVEFINDEETQIDSVQVFKAKIVKLKEYITLTQKQIKKHDRDLVRIQKETTGDQAVIRQGLSAYKVAKDISCET